MLRERHLALTPYPLSHCGEERGTERVELEVMSRPEL